MILRIGFCLRSKNSQVEVEEALTGLTVDVGCSVSQICGLFRLGWELSGVHLFHSVLYRVTVSMATFDWFKRVLHSYKVMSAIAY